MPSPPLDEPSPLGVAPGVVPGSERDARVARQVPSVPAAAEGRRWRSSELFAGCPEIEIEHGAAIYRLRRTALGKLILTK